MPRFRKKPVTISAEQWFPGKKVQGVAEDGGVAVVPTLEGLMRVNPGDWIITGVKGERYPCRPDIFEATYERVDDHEG